MRQGIRIRTVLLAPAALLVLGTLPACRDPGVEDPGIPAAASSKSEGSTVHYDRTVWPTSARNLSSGFGPRLKASESFRYDFHRGIDIPGTAGDPVVAIADGVIFRTYFEGDPSSPFPEGGNVVVLRHVPDVPFPFHGRTFDIYYSLYLHLDAITVNRPTPGGPYESIAAGVPLGTLGQSGSTTFDHLHLEVRIGTTCSREYQIANPGEPCASTFGATPQDPHVNPFLFLSYDDRDVFEVRLLRLDPLQVRVRSRPDELDFNEIRVSRGGVERVVNLNDRAGIDPTNIDNPGYGGVTIRPAAFNASSSVHEIDFEFPGFAGYDVIEVRDVWGKGLRLRPQPPDQRGPGKDLSPVGSIGEGIDDRTGVPPSPE